MLWCLATFGHMLLVRENGAQVLLETAYWFCLDALEYRRAVAGPIPER